MGASRPRRSSPFAIRGVVEGFYGPFYTSAERNALLRFLGSQNFNVYLYAPKDDRRGRTRWWEAYPSAEMEAFARTVTIARAHGVAFAYALSFNGTSAYAGTEALTAMERKLAAFAAIGVRDFALCFDDSACVRDNSENRAAFGTCAAAHAAIANHIDDWLQREWPGSRLIVCPRTYHGIPRPRHGYLRALGAALHPEVLLMYTGRDIRSATITAQDVRTFASVVGRRPLLWDNTHVNDLDARDTLPLGPYAGRSADIGAETAGILINGMAQPFLSRLPLATVAAYLRDPAAYDPITAWEQAITLLVAPGIARNVRAFAGALWSSPLWPVDDAPLTLLARAVAADPSGSHTRLLAQTLDQLDAACYALKTDQRLVTWRAEALPWVEAMMAWIRVGQHALSILSTPADPSLALAHRRLREARTDARRYGHRTIERGLEALALAALISTHGEKVAPLDNRRTA